MTEGCFLHQNEFPVPCSVKLSVSHVVHKELIFIMPMKLNQNVLVCICNILPSPLFFLLHIYFNMLLHCISLHEWINSLMYFKCKHNAKHVEVSTCNTCIEYSLIVMFTKKALIYQFVFVNKWTVTFQISTQCPTAGTLWSWTDKYAPLWARAVNSTSWTKGGNIRSRCVALILIISHVINIMKYGGSETWKPHAHGLAFFFCSCYHAKPPSQL